MISWHALRAKCTEKHGGLSAMRGDGWWHTMSLSTLNRQIMLWLIDRTTGPTCHTGVMVDLTSGRVMAVKWSKMSLHRYLYFYFPDSVASSYWMCDGALSYKKGKKKKKLSWMERHHDFECVMTLWWQQCPLFHLVISWNKTMSFFYCPCLLLAGCGVLATEIKKK